MINIAVVGCTGKLGSAIARSILKRDDVNLKYAVGRAGNPYVGCDVATVIGGSDTGMIIISDVEDAADCDVFIDCTSAEAFMGKNLSKYDKMNKPLVIATTAFSEEDKKEICNLANRIPVFMTGNFSIALHDFIETLKFAGRKISKDTDVQIVEYHHNQKKDAPSGTALMIRDALISVNENLSEDKINICSVRGGSIFGEHQVIFANCKDEVTTYRHQVSSREPFSDGAVEVAVWTAGRDAGLYGMDDFCNR